MPLIRRYHGRIVNIGSIRGRLAVPLSGPYSASKFAMEGLTDVLRQELKPWGIHVSLVQPGTIDTGIHDKADKLLKHLPAEAEQMYRPLIDAVRSTKEKKVRAAIPPDEVAEVVMRALTAVRPKSRYLVGTDAKIHALLASILPDRLRDAVVSRYLGIPGSLD
jgi:short-subunit dehydrogenase